MSLTSPFAGWLPAADRCSQVIAPPYDVVSTEEARARVHGKPLSFLHVSRPEIDLPVGTDVHSPPVYAQAAINWHGLQAAGAIAQWPRDAYYVYRMQMGEHVQTGVVVAADVAAYREGRIARHELTRPDKEDDRVQHILAVAAQTGPALLAWRGQPQLVAALEQVASRPADLDAVGDGDVRHSLWVVDEPHQLQALHGLLCDLPKLYIADGHHRSAAASRVAAAQPGNPKAQRFLAVAYAAEQMQILPYHRVVKDLAGLTADQLLAAAGSAFAVQRLGGRPQLTQRGDLGVYLNNAWYLLRIHPDRIPADPVGRLDVSLLHDHLIAPYLHITDPRRDPRIDFVGGVRGLSELERRVDSGEMAVAFALHATSMADLMAVADAGLLMPPKSTWFEPKLADAMVSYGL